MIKKLSIVTPTYNRVDSIKKNIDSIKSQKIPIFEHIIVDNCSNDGTKEYIEEYQTSAPYNVIYIRKPDSGIYNAMNKGVAAASGDWVHILNSDDYYSSADSLSGIKEELERDDLDIIVNAITMAGTKGTELWIPEYDDEKRHYRFPHPGMIISKEFYNKVGSYSERYKIISDAVWTIKNIKKSRYVIKENSLVTMAIGGASSSLSWKNIWEPFVCNVFFHSFPWRYKLKYTKKSLKQLRKLLRSKKS